MQENLTIPQGLDPAVVNLARAIRQQESGGDYARYGDSNSSYGAYQWNNQPAGKSIPLSKGQIPSNFQSDATSYGLDPNDFSPHNQDMVAYNKIKALKDNGHNVVDIAAIWNGGDAKRQDPTYVTPSGLPSQKKDAKGKDIYNVPQYAQNVNNLYQSYKEKTLGQSSDQTQPLQNMGDSSMSNQPQPSQGGFLSNLGQNFVGGLKQFGSGISQLFSGGQQTDNLGAGAYNMISGAGQAVAGGINTALSPISAGIQTLGQATGLDKPISQGIDYAANKINDALPFLQPLMQKYPGLEQDVANAITIGGTLVGGAKAPEIGKAIEPVTAPVGEALSKVTAPIKSALEDRYVQQTISDWERVGGDYVKTNKLLEADEARANPTQSFKPTTEFLGEMGITPKSLIEDGKFGKASELADKLSGTAVKPFEDVLNQQLREAQYGQALTKVDELLSGVKSRIEAIQNISETDRKTMLNSAVKELNLLKAKHPRGISLEDLNKQKGIYWAKTKFDITKPLQPQVNYNLGTIIKDLIETKAGDANIRELNGVLGNYYKAAKFLNELAPRKPILTSGQKVIQGIAKGVGTAIGEKLVGGIGGDIGGYLVGRSVGKMLDGVSNPVKGMILRNLEKSDPVAYKKAILWLGKKEAERFKTLRLESPSPLGTTKNPIITPAPTTFESQATQAQSTKTNKTGDMYTRDLKTGKMTITPKK